MGMNADVREAIAIAIEGCACTIVERDSGHKVGCYVPMLLAALQAQANAITLARSLSPSSPREPSEAAHLSKHARDRLEEIAARAYRDDVAATVVLSPMEAYAILRAIDFPPSGGTT